jgi:hypothetical protein
MLGKSRQSRTKPKLTNPLKISLSESSKKKTSASENREVEAVVASESTPPFRRKLKTIARCSRNTSDSRRSTRSSQRDNRLRLQNARRRTA